jgi:predicted ATP-dependent Lon-type protease
MSIKEGRVYKNTETGVYTIVDKITVDSEAQPTIYITEIKDGSEKEHIVESRRIHSKFWGENIEIVSS